MTVNEYVNKLSDEHACFDNMRHLYQNVSTVLGIPLDEIKLDEDYILAATDIQIRSEK